jgi:hypothetical protein
MTCGHGAVLSAAKLMFAPHNTVTTLSPATPLSVPHTDGR